MNVIWLGYYFLDLVSMSHRVSATWEHCRQKAVTIWRENSTESIIGLVSLLWQIMIWSVYYSDQLESNILTNIYIYIYTHNYIYSYWSCWYLVSINHLLLLLLFQHYSHRSIRCDVTRSSNKSRPPKLPRCRRSWKRRVSAQESKMGDFVWKYGAFHKFGIPNNVGKTMP